jgi:adenylate kinase family enzyme
LPILEYYRSQGKLVSVNGDRKIEEVTKEILSALEEANLG